jgi:hypothetical protein
MKTSLTPCDPARPKRSKRNNRSRKGFRAKRRGIRTNPFENPKFRRFSPKKSDKTGNALADLFRWREPLRQGTPMKAKITTFAGSTFAHPIEVVCLTVPARLPHAKAAKTGKRELHRSSLIQSLDCTRTATTAMSGTLRPISAQPAWGTSLPENVRTKNADKCGHRHAIELRTKSPAPSLPWESRSMQSQINIMAGRRFRLPAQLLCDIPDAENGRSKNRPKSARLRLPRRSLIRLFDCTRTARTDCRSKFLPPSQPLENKSQAEKLPVEEPTESGNGSVRNLLKDALVCGMTARSPGKRNSEHVWRTRYKNSC